MTWFSVPLSLAVLLYKTRAFEVSAINDVILVGGQITYATGAKNRCRVLRVKKPRKDVNPDEAVAMGAAIQGAVLSGDVKDVSAARREPTDPWY